MRRYWTVPQLREFAQIYPTTAMLKLMARYGRSRSAIKNLAVKLGLRKTDEHIREYCRLRLGHPACGWNRGLRFTPEGSKATQFKKGQRGPRQRPVGAERITCDGVEVKVAEPNVWEPKARVVWKSHFGEIPQGFICRPKEKRNFSPENLMLISRQENASLNASLRKPRRPKLVSPSWAHPVLNAARA